MKKLIKKLNTYQLFTLIFIVLCIGVFFTFLKNGRSFIWSTDGFKQHYIFLENFHETIGGSFFSWNLGLGLDKIGQLSYYTLGDPFAYLSLLFNIDNLKYVYGILIILRMYCVGLSFIKYCNYHKRSKFATLIGAIIYTFSGYVLYATVRHPFFANAAIWLPLMFLGIDKILKEDRYKLFTFISAISAISNYYFFYMITILTFIYAVIKYWVEYKEKGAKVFWSKLIKTTLCYIIGVLSASILLLPTIYAFSNNSRSIDTVFTYYDFGYYAKLLFMSDKTPFWTKVYVSPLAIVFLPISILNFKKNKETRTWLINLLIYFVILLLPFLGSLMNGFSFQSNRWTFGVCFALSYLVTINIRSDLIYSQREFKFVKNFLIIYALLWFVLKSQAGLFPITTIALAFLYIIILVSRSLDYPEIKKNQYFQYAKNLKSPESNKIKNRVKVILIIVVCINTLYFSWELFNHNKYAQEFIKYKDVESRYDSLGNQLPHFSEAISYIKSIDKSFYRIATNVPESNNESYKYGYNSLNTYLSIGNKYVTLLSKDLMILNNAKTNPLREFDSRTKITTLLSSKYYIVSKKKNTYVPYGYNLIYEIKDINNDENTAQIYENQNYLPIGVFYDNYTLKQEYDRLSALEKEQALLKTAVVENTDEIKKYSIKSNTEDLSNLQEQNIKFTINDTNKIVDQTAKTIKPKKDKNNFKLTISNTAQNCELYLLITNQKYSKNDEYTITVTYNKQKKQQVIRDKVESPYYIETPNILFNLGYRDIHTGNITITFSTTSGEYTYDDIKLIAVPFDNYTTDITNLKSNALQMAYNDDETISGTIYANSSGILQISTSYTSGWKAFVDGKETDTINVNTGFIGIPLNQGEHKIRLKYSTPYLITGAYLSCIGIILMILVFLIDSIYHLNERRKKKNGRKQK